MSENILEHIKFVKSAVQRLTNGLTMLIRNETATFRSATMDFFSKSGGQLQFSVASPRYREAQSSQQGDPGIRWPQRNGAVFIEGAPPLGDGSDNLDWANKKIVFALSDKDIGEILFRMALAQSSPKDFPLAIKLLHAPEDKDSRLNNKTFMLKRESDYKGEPQWSIGIYEKAEGKPDNKVSIFLKGPDYMRLKALLEAALPYTMGLHKT